MLEIGATYKIFNDYFILKYIEQDIAYYLPITHYQNWVSDEKYPELKPFSALRCHEKISNEQWLNIQMELL